MTYYNIEKSSGATGVKKLNIGFDGRKSWTATVAGGKMFRTMEEAEAMFNTLSSSIKKSAYIVEHHI